MQQEINLYLLLPKAEKRILSLETVIVLYLVFVIFLFLNYTFLLAKKSHLLDEMQQLNSQLTSEKKHLDDILAKYPLINPEDLQGSLGRLQANLASKAKLLEAVATPAKFSDYLIVLSNTDITGAWLTGFAVTNNGLKLELYGQAINHEKVNTYYVNLRKQPYFSKMDFSVTDISHPKTDDTSLSGIGFTITGKATSYYEQ